MWVAAGTDAIDSLVPQLHAKLQTALADQRRQKEVQERKVCVSVCVCRRKFKTARCVCVCVCVCVFVCGGVCVCVCVCAHASHMQIIFQDSNQMAIMKEQG